MKNIIVRTTENVNLVDFLFEHDYAVEEVSEVVFQVKKSGEIPVFVSVEGLNMYFEMDLGNIDEIADKDLYFKLLDLNSEILPVSIALNSTNKDDIRLVIVESREIQNIDDNEILSVLSSLELAADKIEILLEDYLK